MNKRNSYLIHKYNWCYALKHFSIHLHCHLSVHRTGTTGLAHPVTSTGINAATTNAATLPLPPPRPHPSIQSSTDDLIKTQISWCHELLLKTLSMALRIKTKLLMWSVRPYTDRPQPRCPASSHSFSPSSPQVLDFPLSPTVAGPLQRVPPAVWSTLLPTLSQVLLLSLQIPLKCHSLRFLLHKPTKPYCSIQRV